MTDIINSFADFIVGIFGDSFNSILDFIAFAMSSICEGFVYIFDICLSAFTETVFSNFDESKIIFVGEFTLDSIFSHNFATSDLIFNNFLFFFIGLIAFVFVFKLFFKIFCELLGAFIHALKAI